MAQPHPIERPRTREEVFRRVVEVLLAQEKKPLRIAVFGSWARGEQRPDSDLDVVVDYDDIGAFELAGYWSLLQEQLGMRVDLTTRGGLRKLYPRVAPELKSIYP